MLFIKKCLIYWVRSWQVTTLGSLLVVGWRLPSMPGHMCLPKIATWFIKVSKRESPSKMQLTILCNLILEVSDITLFHWLFCWLNVSHQSQPC